ncbi:DUF2889 domain-containing protein [Leptospira santarosai]|uniref:PF11136 family protein n=3 Tax=Leptospira santarosai TaxID=28183 RepID=M6V1Q8_9LEPT|nr:DUF2889 domain-containing protein [Leptospira santarosai]EMO57762.1 PF11136 family protein [Leptospira santarosai str. CBC1416]EKO33118.1 PF11136 family protein [Leptospira santarosai str. MOR084]EMJ47847.1 PF11136 family protein [Leptospira santarosai str. HAI1349]EMO22187.1 PF11136 family protein [Leptospira santarosai str. HAI134]EMO43468.1 PF11136 family protein [Leptospira santarosai str. ZUN179]
MNTLQELKERIRFRSTDFQRNYESRYYWFPEESPPLCVVEVNQYDPYHDITLYLEVDLTTMKIVKSGVEEKRVPYETCPAAIKTYDYLVGEDMSYVKLMNRFPADKTLGCLHINELIQNAAMNFHSAYAFYLKERNFPARFDEYKMYEGDLPAQERREIGRHWWMKDRGVKNSCYSFSGRHEKPELKDQVKHLDSITAMMVKEFKKSKKGDS